MRPAALIPVLVFAIGVGATSSERQEATAAGIVVDSASGGPLAAVHVVAYATRVRFAGRFAVRDSSVATSDAQGRFVLQGLRSGSYAAWLSPPFGHCPAWAHFTVPSSGTDSLRVSLGRWSCGEDFCMCGAPRRAGQQPN